MAIETKTEERTRKVTVRVTTICDLCGAVTESHRTWPGHEGNLNEVSVSYKHGNSWREGGSGEEVIFDICPTCFLEKVVPVLQGMGAEYRTEEWDW